MKLIGFDRLKIDGFFLQDEVVEKKWLIVTNLNFGFVSLSLRRFFAKFGQFELENITCGYSLRSNWSNFSKNSL